jgi:NADH-quinone oxidoreductase subunit I
MQVKRPQLTFWEKTYLPQILGGLWTTLKHIPKKKVTLQYPEQRPTLPEKYRGVPTLVRAKSDGHVKCVSCQLCEFVCPPKAIRITPGFRAEEAFDANIEKEPKEFEINMLRCIYCGYCEEVCPEEAIFLQKDFAAVGFTREEMVFNKQKLLELGGYHDDKIKKWQNK